MAYNLNEINERCRTDAAGFIAECDAVYADRLEKAADRIQANLEHSPIVLLSGPSGSGKTTTAMKICEVLESRGIRTHSVSLDDYFKTVSPVWTWICSTSISRSSPGARGSTCPNTTSSTRPG